MSVLGNKYHAPEELRSNCPIKYGNKRAIRQKVVGSAEGKIEVLRSLKGEIDTDMQAIHDLIKDHLTRA